MLAKRANGRPLASFRASTAIRAMCRSRAQSWNLVAAQTWHRPRCSSADFFLPRHLYCIGGLSLGFCRHGALATAHWVWKASWRTPTRTSLAAVITKLNPALRGPRQICDPSRPHPRRPAACWRPEPCPARLGCWTPMPCPSCCNPASVAQPGPKFQRGAARPSSSALAGRSNGRE